MDNESRNSYDSNEITQEVTDNAQNKIGTYTSKFTVIAGLGFVILLCFFIAFGLYIIISRTIFNQSKVIIPQTKVPIVGTTYTKYSIENFNKAGNGKRRTYTFWIYINDLNKYRGSYKHVFHIGDVDDITKGSPYVFLDKNENKLYVRFAATQASSDTYNSAGLEIRSSVQSLSDFDRDKYMQQGVQIPYIPIQRWVHIAIVVNENTNGGTITAYVDADLSKTVSTNDSREMSIANLDLDKMGDLHIGGSFESVMGPGFSGLISKVSLFNYDLNDRDIYNDYSQGPLDGFLASLGLANYGIRNPIYRIS
jgi:hypothetical protein